MLIHILLIYTLLNHMPLNHMPLNHKLPKSHADLPRRDALR